MKFLPLVNLKNTTGIIDFCKETNEVIIANRNGLPKLVLMSREVYENGLGKVFDTLFNVQRDMMLVAEPMVVKTFNNPAEVVRRCEKEVGKIIPVLRNGIDEIYVMDYEAYRIRKEKIVQDVIKKLKHCL